MQAHAADHSSQVEIYLRTKESSRLLTEVELQKLNISAVPLPSRVRPGFAPPHQETLPSVLSTFALSNLRGQLDLHTLRCGLRAAGAESRKQGGVH